MSDKLKQQIAERKAKNMKGRRQRNNNHKEDSKIEETLDLNTIPEAPTETIQEELININPEVPNPPEIAVNTVQSVIDVSPFSNRQKEVVLKFPRFHDLINEVVYIGSLGGRLSPTFLPRIGGYPYIVKMLLTNKEYETYLAKPPKQEYNESKQYVKGRVSGTDRIAVFKQIVKLASEGYVTHPKKVPLNGTILLVDLYKEVDLIAKE